MIIALYYLAFYHCAMYPLAYCFLEQMAFFKSGIIPLSSYFRHYLYTLSRSGMPKHQKKKIHENQYLKDTGFCIQLRLVFCCHCHESHHVSPTTFVHLYLFLSTDGLCLLSPQENSNKKQNQKAVKYPCSCFCCSKLQRT